MEWKFRFDISPDDLGGKYLKPEILKLGHEYASFEMIDKRPSYAITSLASSADTAPNRSAAALAILV